MATHDKIRHFVLPVTHIIKSTSPLLTKRTPCHRWFWSWCCPRSIVPPWCNPSPESHFVLIVRSPITIVNFTTTLIQRDSFIKLRNTINSEYEIPDFQFNERRYIWHFFIYLPCLKIADVLYIIIIYCTSEKICLRFVFQCFVLDSWCSMLLKTLGIASLDLGQ